ncbi:hypothetical protein C5167_031697 [Papaver somniferum]|uniref:Uncharacterized protein n=1 Tax=Papaver somniferum TaxID=3469 RepID=A0A4Y7K908_PAPSO|nr:uncharacterized protein LOC113293039 isoform X2 [Papaver somniferum]RZC68419.1 hypothetical protein C5167_031697 [Papaver somniferum]
MDHMAASNIEGLRLGDPIVQGQLLRIRLQERVAQNGRMPIVIDEQSGVLVGEHGSHLSGECDTILHAFAPLGYKSWTKIPLQDKETFIEQLKDNFILDTSVPSVKRCLNYRMSKGYASFKQEMLMHFRNHATIEEARGNPFGTSYQQIGQVCVTSLLWRVQRILRNAVIVTRILRPQEDSFSIDGKDLKDICYGTTESSYK